MPSHVKQINKLKQNLLEIQNKKLKKIEALEKKEAARLFDLALEAGYLDHDFSDAEIKNVIKNMVEMKISSSLSVTEPV